MCKASVFLCPETPQTHDRTVSCILFTLSPPAGTLCSPRWWWAVFAQRGWGEVLEASQQGGASPLFVPFCDPDAHSKTSGARRDLKGRDSGGQGRGWCPIRTSAESLRLATAVCGNNRVRMSTCESTTSMCVPRRSHQPPTPHPPVIALARVVFAREEGTPKTRMCL